MPAESCAMLACSLTTSLMDPCTSPPCRCFQPWMERSPTSSAVSFRTYKSGPVSLQAAGHNAGEQAAGPIGASRPNPQASPPGPYLDASKTFADSLINAAALTGVVWQVLRSLMMRAAAAHPRT